jgi:hypothetical protein
LRAARLDEDPAVIPGCIRITAAHRFSKLY